MAERRRYLGDVERDGRSRIFGYLAEPKGPMIPGASADFRYLKVVTPQNVEGPSVKRTTPNHAFSLEASMPPAHTRKR